MNFSHPLYIFSFVILYAFSKYSPKIIPIFVSQKYYIVNKFKESPRKGEIKIILQKNTLLTKKRFRLSGIKNPTLPLNRCQMCGRLLADFCVTKALTIRTLSLKLFLFLICRYFLKISI